MYLEDKNPNPGEAPLSFVRKNRGELIALLRDEKRWPVGFKWDYNVCASCALGLLLSSATGRTVNSQEAYFEAQTIAKNIGLSWEHGYGVFFNANEAIGCQRGEVLPEHVAALLEAAPYEAAL